MPTALLTGGTGYIGSHTCVELLNAGYETILFDNLCNSSAVVVDRIAQIAGTRPTFVQGDVRDRAELDRLFEAHAIDAVVHFAGLKAVGDSVARPLDYYANNLCGSATLLQSMRAHDVRRLVFSSSATVYDPAAAMPLTESSPTGPTSPYGWSKLIVERMLQDVAAAEDAWRVVSLRYFNPVGAHDSALIGEDPRDTPNNLMPYVAQVAIGRLPYVRVHGDDYPTPDGTGVRDYIHIMDLAAGHVAALRRLDGEPRPEHSIVNLGTGRGHSVLEVLAAYGRVAGHEIPREIGARRAGDSAISYADPTRAQHFLDWVAKRDLDAMCADSWRWQTTNPHGYAS